MATAAHPTCPHATRTIPFLHNGDHLTREEFERRYEAMPDVKKVELIEGIVYMPSECPSLTPSRMPTWSAGSAITSAGPPACASVTM